MAARQRRRNFVRGVSQPRCKLPVLRSMGTNTSDRFFSVVIGLAIMAWPSIEGDMTDSAPGSRDVARKKATPAQHSEEKRVPRSPKK